MLVCLCKGISDRKIRELLEEKAKLSSAEVMRQCGAGTDCGSCIYQIKELVGEKAELDLSPTGSTQNPK